MEDIIGMVATTQEGSRHAFLTWGRIYQNDYDATVQAVVPWLPKFLGRAPHTDLVVAMTLQEISTAPYFHECLSDMVMDRSLACFDDPSLRSPKEWIKRRRASIADGRGIWYLGELPDPQERHTP
ncbi:MAG: hypothetical protein AB7L84_09545 [Acidimicrobiia bacterium]